MRVMAEATMTREVAYDLYHLDRSPHFYEVVAHVDNLEINHIPSRDIVSYDIPAGGVARSAQRPRPPHGTAISPSGLSNGALLGPGPHPDCGGRVGLGFQDIKPDNLESSKRGNKVSDTDHTPGLCQRFEEHGRIDILWQ